MLIANILFCISVIGFWYLCRNQRIKCNDEGWQPIETLPEDLDEYILLTNGKQVRSAAYHSIEFTRKGECKYYFKDDDLATHWRKMPYPPDTTKKETSCSA